MKTFECIEGGVTAAAGFRASGVAAGIKYEGRRDVALLAADKPATVAAVYTANKVAAAPVRLDRERTRSGKAQAVVVNSGCANACTGAQGLADARETARLAAEALGIAEDLVLVCSTGVIGVHLPMGRVAEGVRLASAALSAAGGDDAAHAILTTDTVDKQFAVELEIDGQAVRIGGMCKGSGMIEPNMATMLGFVTTDAVVDAAALDEALHYATDRSFNRVVGDGDMSTNDTVILMASGAAGNRVLTMRHPQWQDFVDALTMVCVELGKKIVMDGEGATKFVTVRVKGALTAEDAQKAARAIAKSPLVKTSWFGLDPNWGRVIAAVGYSGAEVDDQWAQVYYGDICAYDKGRVTGKDALKPLQDVMRKRVFDVTVNLNLGNGEDTVYTYDFSYDYVKINAEYTT
ncbi:MAG: bifunctional glutamate N-acetyltransferase/amino-acid acetyltransferase ArgJ [Kiritimatiellaeota bacterium]|nr:bifunctional glutamate N-acetyltransferase/amino-acid acetyltransferase ArgJ [Kiritimatiellota bacterium]